MKKFAVMIMLLGAMLLCGCGSDEEDGESVETTSQVKVTTQYDI